MSRPDWQSRVNHQTDYLQAPQRRNGRITIIDFAELQDGQLGYRYFSNANTHDQLYEPWSSSKIFAYTGAVATMRKRDVGATSQIGEVSVADLITSINSYEKTNKAPDDSNAIATYFANLATRDYLTRLFHQDWLNINNQDVRFRGAYGPVAYVPTNDSWQDNDKASAAQPYPSAYDDPGYQALSL